MENNQKRQPTAIQEKQSNYKNGDARERKGVSFPRSLEKYQANSGLFLNPRPNMINTLCDDMKELTMQDSKRLQNIADLSKDSKYVANREISSKLNFPQSETIYKNLTKIDTVYDESSEFARKADKLILKSARKISEKSSLKKSQEIREEISSLIKDLVDLEYNEGEKSLKTVKSIPLPSGEDYLGFTKFSTPNIILPNKRTETQRFLDRINEEVERELCKTDNCLEPQWVMVKKKQRENSCLCLNEFYTQHSFCS